MDQNVPKDKQTTLGLYLTAQEACAMWQADPETVKILDVRTPEEYLYVGHAPTAWSIPLGLQVYQWDAAKGEFPFVPNPQFLDQVKTTFNPADMILVMCRSGGRSAKAVDIMAEAGFKNVYNIVDGMEGDLVKDPDSTYDGQRMRNGWKNARAPYTCQVTPEKTRWPQR